MKYYSIERELAGILKAGYKNMNDEHANALMLQIVYLAGVLHEKFNENMIRDIDKIRPSQFENLADASLKFYTIMILFGEKYDFDENTKCNIIAIAVKNMFDLPLDRQTVLLETGIALFDFANTHKFEVFKLLTEK